MSGGFFRGTSADQDTRFSNKQAKLLKTQKFAPELEHLIDVSKVKMDVMKPWIAKRVTEFLGGFEDEVLINFIYGLLEGKEINGKAVQIQLTGFMEKNTGKFMKELWGLLLSAQNNASGVPQQFLDAKEEETKKKKAETDRITSEIQRRREKETEQEKMRKMDGDFDDNSAEDPNRRRRRGFDAQSGDENGTDARNGFRGRNRSPRSPSLSDRSPSPHRGRHSRSNSYSNSRSYSKGRSVSKSISPRQQRHSLTPEPVRRTPQRSVSPRKPTERESLSPRRRSHSRRSLSRTRHRSPSPMRRRFRPALRGRSPSPYRRRSPSPYRRRSPSPYRRRSPSPYRRRSPSPYRRRSPSPYRRRSPARRRRSPSPWRRRSPFVRRHRSPSPIRHRRRRSTSSPRSRSPVRRPSPVRRRYQSPVRRRSPYPVRRRSPPLDRRGSPSPRRHRSSSPVQHSSPSPRKRSPTRSLSRSVSPASRSSGSPDRDISASPIKKSLRGSPTERTRLNDRAGPAMLARRQSMAMSPLRDHSDISRSRRKVPSISPSPEKSPSYTVSPKQKTRSSGVKRLASPHGSHGSSYKSEEDDGSQSPLSEMKGQRVRHSGPQHNKEELKISREGEQNKHKSTERTSDWSSGVKIRGSVDEPPNRLSETADFRQEDTESASLEVSPEVHVLKRSPHGRSVSKERQITSYPGGPAKSEEKRRSQSKDAGDNSRPNASVNPRKKRRSPSVSSDSGSGGSDKQKLEVTDKRKRRRSSRREAVSDDTSSESEIEDRKEAKRRKKEERKLRKEERRRRRQKKEEKRASKRKRKSKDADELSSDLEKNEKHDEASNGGPVVGKYSREKESESQRIELEIELRRKALESLNAKKGARQ